LLPEVLWRLCNNLFLLFLLFLVKVRNKKGKNKKGGKVRKNMDLKQWGISAFFDRGLCRFSLLWLSQRGGK
jgi:hypothetical protein